MLALAKTSKAAARLSHQFRERTCEKIYLALVSGVVGEEDGRLENSLIRDGSVTRLAFLAEKGKTCALSWRVRHRFKAAGLTLLEINLQSGFKHQIRAQLAGQGWPVVGDLKYQSPRKGDGPAIGLWAASLSIDHPTKKERLVFRADPADIWPWTLL